MYELKPVRKNIENPDLIRLLGRWQTNNSPDDLGIVRFGFELFPHILKRKYGTAGWVRKALYEVLKYKKGDTKLDRCHAICTYREGSKSTWFGQILPLYFLLVGQYGVYYRDTLLPEIDYIRLRAKNSDEAEKKLLNVTNEFTNPLVLKLFGRLEPNIKEVRDEKLKKTTKFVILRNGYIYQAIGLNQPARGANIKGRRPKMDIPDDVENKENTKTATMRQYNADEILGEQFAGLDKEGITIYIGNFVHTDCLMRHLLSEKNVGWKKQFYQISHIDKETGEEVADWPSRFPIKYIHKLKRWYAGHPKLGGEKRFYMEYYNKLISDKDYRIIDFKGGYLRKNGTNWVRKEAVNELGEKHYELYNAQVIVSLDPAISEKSKSSDGCVTATAFCSDGQRRVIDVSLAKFDIRDRYIEAEDEMRIKNTKILATLPEELALLRRRGGVEEAVRFVLKYHAEGIVIENAGQQLAWYNDVKELLTKLQIRIKILPYHPKDEKEYKLQVGLLNWFAAGYYELLSSMVFYKYVREQIETFPDSTLDILDALHNAEILGKIPSPIGLNVYGDSKDERDEVSTLYDEIDANEDIEAYAVIG